MAVQELKRRAVMTVRASRKAVSLAKPPSCGALPALASSPPSCGIFFRIFLAATPTKRQNVTYLTPWTNRSGSRRADGKTTTIPQPGVSSGSHAACERWWRRGN